MHPDKISINQIIVEIMEMNFKELTVDELYGALACYNGDPFLVENEEQAIELLEYLQQDGCECKVIEDGEEFEIAKKRLDLKDADVVAIYDCGCWNQSHAIVCFNGDWSV